MVRPRRCARKAVPATALALALAASVSACSGDDEPKADPAPAASSAPSAAAPLETTARLGRVTGRLGRPERERLRSTIAGVVDAWIDAAYLGDFPRTDFTGAFPGFTKGAAADARADGRSMSNERVGARVDDVVAVRREVVVDALATRKRAVAVTARFVLAMDLEGDVQRTDRVRGRLFLTRSDGAWKVFGYDVDRGVVR
ncbi:hypothetical protein [Nocardioides sp. 503]|uniref:hypothetical protein n=1 Tax=Nocardioides sp. 503 TaxID=2508326 RepID=UPI0014313072|nr:hypothetical protein [Nocardioides sp. 503]